MNRGTRNLLANVMAAALLMVWVGVGLGVWYVPRLASHWAQMGIELSVAQRWLVQLADLLSRGYWAVGPVLVAATLYVVLWCIGAHRRDRSPAT